MKTISVRNAQWHQLMDWDCALTLAPEKLEGAQLVRRLEKKDGNFHVAFTLTEERYALMLSDLKWAMDTGVALDKKRVRENWLVQVLFDLAVDIQYDEVMKGEVAELPVCMNGVALDDRTVGVEWSLHEATTVMWRISSSKSDTGKIVLRRLGDVIGDTVVLVVTLPASIFAAARAKQANCEPKVSLSKSVIAAIEEAHRSEDAKNHASGPAYELDDEIPF